MYSLKKEHLNLTNKKITAYLKGYLDIKKVKKKVKFLFFVIDLYIVCV